MEEISANYDSSRTTSITPDQNEKILPAPDRQTPAEVPSDRDERNEADNLPEIQHSLNYFNTLDQYPCQPQTPAQFGNFDRYDQSNDIVTGLLSCGEKDDILANSDNSPGCFCPADSCNCLRQHGLGQEQGQGLALTAVPLKPPAKTLQRRLMPEDWNLDEFLADGSLHTDALNG